MFSCNRKFIPHQSIGFWTATALVMGVMLGSGVFSLPASLASYGSISIFAWIITGLGSLFIALTFVNLNKVAPETGGAFLFTSLAYGEFMGFSMALTYWFAWCVGCAGCVVAVMEFLAPFFPIFNDHDLHFSVIYSTIVKIGIIWMAIFINLFGTKFVGKTQLISNLFKILPLIIITIVGLNKFHWANIIHYYNISGKTNWEALNASCALTLFAFTGMEAAVVPSNDINNHSVIAKATVAGTIFISLFYVLISFSLFGLFPAAQMKNSFSPFTDAGVLLFGHWGAYAIAVCAIITIIGSINGGILILAQDAMGAARKKLFPKIFGDNKNKYHAPIKGILISGVVMSLMILLTTNESLNKEFNFLILLSTLSLIIPYFTSSTAAMLLFKKYPGLFSRKQYVLALVTAIFSSLYAFWMMIGAGVEVVFYGCLFFFSIFWVYFLYQSFKN